MASITVPLVMKVKRKQAPTGDVTGSAAYTDATGTPYLGTDPLMDPVGRGLYSSSDLAGLAFMDTVETLANPALADPPYDPTQGTDPGDDTFFSGGGAGTGQGSQQRGGGVTGGGTTGGGTTGGGTTGGSTGGGSGGGSGNGTSGNPKSVIGLAFPWEACRRAGGSSAAPAYVDTQTGNLLTVLPIVKWSMPGGGNCGLTLYHNSQDDMDLGWGNNWRSNYDFYIINLGPNSTTGQNQVAISYPTGMRLVYTQMTGIGESNFYSPPTGFYDALIQTSATTFTLRTKDQTVYYFSSATSAGLNAGPLQVGQSFGFYGYRLNQIQDRYGNSISISNSAGTATISSSLGTISLPVHGALNSNQVLAWVGYSSISAPGQRTWTITNSVNSRYGGSSQLLSIAYPTIASVNPTEVFTYNSGMAVLSETSKDGSQFNFTYSPQNKLLSFNYPAPFEIFGGTIKSFGTYTYSYGATSATRVDPFNYATTDNYDSGFLRSQVDESGFSNEYLYDTKYNITGYRDQRTLWSSAFYDAFGNCLSSQTPRQYAQGVKQQATYDNWNDLVTSTDTRGAVTKYMLSGTTKGELLSVVDGLGNTLVTNTYDQFGDIASSSSANATTSVVYDNVGRPLTITTPDRTYQVAWSSSPSSPPGVPASVTDSTMGRTTLPFTDSWGRVTAVQRSDGISRSVAYDYMNRVVTSTDYLGKSASFAYDLAGRLLHATNARGDTTTYGWRDMDLFYSVTDGNGNAKTYLFSPRGDVASVTLGDNSTEGYLYDADGNNAFDFDERQTSMTDSTGTTTWTYDFGNRLTQLAQPLGILTYTYDQWGRRTTATSPSGQIAYAYTGDRLTQVTSPQNEVATYSYNPTSGLLTKQTNGNGTYTSFAYDSLDRVSAITHSFSSGSTIEAETYAYDYDSQLTSKVASGITTNYTYDAIGQLLTEASPGMSIGYTYDGNHNRLTKTLGSTIESYTYDKGDKLLSRSSSNGTWSYSYDAAGRTIGVAYPTGSTALTYDYEDRVASITTSPTGGTSTTTGYLYNAFDARAEKTSGSTVLQQYLRDGAGPADDMLANTTTTFTPGVSEHAGGTTRYLHEDRLGTAVSQTNSSQTQTNTFSSDSFGNPYQVTNPNGTQAGFAADCNYQTDSESGLLLLGHRYYDPAQGRFITRDPIGAGNNWYAYCRNNPLNATDSLGFDTSNGDNAEGWAAEEVEDAADQAGIQLPNPTQEVQETAKDNFWGTFCLWVEREVRRAFEGGGEPEDEDVPRPGKRGNSAHRRVVGERERQIKQDHPDWGHVGGGSLPENRVDTNGGLRPYRYPDLEFSKPDGSLVYEQVGRINMSGIPVSRELDAIEDLMGPASDVNFTPYNNWASPVPTASPIHI
jgi:RHS repeat-associated protein